MAHTRHPVVNFILWAIFFVLLAFVSFFLLLMFAVGDSDDHVSPELRKMENALRYYRMAALFYYTDNDEWPPAGEYLPDSPMVISLDHYTDKSFDKERYALLLIKEIPAGSKRFYLGLRPGERSPLSPISIKNYGYLVARNKLDNLFRADGLPYSSDIIGSGDIFAPMNLHTGKGCL